MRALQIILPGSSILNGPWFLVPGCWRLVTIDIRCSIMKLRRSEDLSFIEYRESNIEYLFVKSKEVKHSRPAAVTMDQ